MGIIGTIIIGLIVGLIARFLKPGDDSMGWIMTILLGIAGSLAATYGGHGAGALPGAALEDLIAKVKELDMDEIRAEIAKQGEEIGDLSETN